GLPDGPHGEGAGGTARAARARDGVDPPGPGRAGDHLADHPRSVSRCPDAPAAGHRARLPCYILAAPMSYIIPMPPPAAAAAAAARSCGFSGLSAMSASVVSRRAAIDAAFCRAERVTFAG